MVLIEDSNNNNNNNNRNNDINNKNPHLKGSSQKQLIEACPLKHKSTSSIGHFVHFFKEINMLCCLKKDFFPVLSCCDGTQTSVSNSICLSPSASFCSLLHSAVLPFPAAALTLSHYYPIHPLPPIPHSSPSPFFVSPSSITPLSSISSSFSFPPLPFVFLIFRRQEDGLFLPALLFLCITLSSVTRVPDTSGCQGGERKAAMEGSVMTDRP